MRIAPLSWMVKTVDNEGCECELLIIVAGSDEGRKIGSLCNATVTNLTDDFHTVTMEFERKYFIFAYLIKLTAQP